MIKDIRGGFYGFSVAVLLYATLIVDLYRKIGGGSVEAIRNVFYIISFGLILVDIVKTRRLTKMLLIFIFVSIIFLVSSAINNGYNSIYMSTWILFVSRLLPSYYVGRYTDNWDDVSKFVSKLSWFALLYAVIAIATPYDGTSNAYATIATNLAFVSFITLRYSIINRNYLKLGISLICISVVLFLGTRAVFVGTILSIIFTVSLYINSKSKVKKMILWTVVTACIILIILSFSTILEELIKILPNSRTLIMLSKGNMMDDSNRSDSFYAVLIDSLETNPFKMHGFLGDRIFLAGYGASNESILSHFSHNVILEICMNFGLVLGLIISIYFIYILLKAVIVSKNNDYTIRYVFFSFLGITLVNMMVSSSYLGSYYIWVLYGFAFRFVNKKVSL